MAIKCTFIIFTGSCKSIKHNFVIEMKIYTVPTGNMKLDGGAMFGVVPKSLWTRQYDSDENNMVNISMRSLFIVDGDRKILFDNGVGDKQDDKFFGYYYLFGDDTLEGSLNRLGYGLEDITDMVLTHLHFDHCGGSVKYNADRTKLHTVFPNARYWVGKPQWELAQNPNRLEGASLLEENIKPIGESGQLELIDDDFQLTPNVMLRLFHGHTVGQIVGLVRYGYNTIVNTGDLIPLVGNISMSWICGYDTQPLVTLREKEDFLKESLENDYICYFYHDLDNECCTLKDTIKGIRPDRTFALSEITS
jgi:glyoxylase-like metal-dependent hydrolase (beta-lactamase superfamily II)